MAKSYKGTVACRDGLIRTVTITDTTASTEDVKNLRITSLSFDMNADDDPYTVMRETTGTLTVLNTNGFLAEEIIPNGCMTHTVVIENSNGAVEFEGFVSMDVYSQEYTIEGEPFDIPIVSRLAIAESVKADIVTLTEGCMPYDSITVIDAICHCAKKLGFSGTLCLPKLWGNSVSGCPTPYALTIGRFNTIEKSGIDSRDQDYTYWESLSVSDVLKKIADFYCITFTEYQGKLIATAADNGAFLQFDIETGAYDTEGNYGNVYDNDTIIVDAQKSFMAGPRKISLVFDRDQADEIVSGAETKCYKYTAGMTYYFYNASSEMRSGYSWIYNRNSMDSLAECLRYSSTAINTNFCWGATPTKFKNFSSENGIEADGFTIYTYKTGAQIYTSTSETLDNTKPVIRLNSEGLFIQRTGTITLKMSAMACRKASTTSFSMIDLSETNSSGQRKYHTYVFAKLKIGDYESQTAVVFSPSDSDYWQNCEGLASWQINETVIESVGTVGGPITIEISVGNNPSADTNRMECFVVMLYDVKATFSHFISEHDITADENLDPSDLRYSHLSLYGQSGDNYEKEMDLTYYYPAKKFDWNCVGLPDYGDFDTVNNKLYGIYLLDRLRGFLDRRKEKIELTVPMYFVESFGSCTMPLYNHFYIGETRYIITSISRDYGSGFDKITLIKK